MITVGGFGCGVGGTGWWVLALFLVVCFDCLFSGFFYCFLLVALWFANRLLCVWVWWFWRLLLWWLGGVSWGLLVLCFSWFLSVYVVGLHATGSVVVVALCGGLVILRVCWVILVVNVGICVAVGWAGGSLGLPLFGCGRVVFLTFSLRRVCEFNLAVVYGCLL